MSKSLELFSTPSDLAALIDGVLEHEPVTFVVAGVFDTPGVVRLETSGEIGANIAASQNPWHAFLVVHGAEAVAVRDVPQRKGGTRYAIDQQINPRSISLRPGLLIDERTLLAGQIGTVSQDPASLSLYSAFAKVVQRNFVRIGSYRVGPDAERLLDSGERLTADLRAPSIYDLARDPGNRP